MTQMSPGRQIRCLNCVMKQGNAAQQEKLTSIKRPHQEQWSRERKKLSKCRFVDLGFWRILYHRNFHCIVRENRLQITLYFECINPRVYLGSGDFEGWSLGSSIRQERDGCSISWWIPGKASWPALLSSGSFSEASLKTNTSEVFLGTFSRKCIFTITV